MQQFSSLSPIRFGIAGLGQMGTYHLERFCLRKDIRAVAAYDPRESQAGVCTIAGCDFCHNWNELLAHPEVDVVLIATPTNTHAALAIEALKAGKPVVVERPLCLTPDEADAITRAEHQAQHSVTVMQCRRWDDDFRTALATVQSGALGEMTTAKLIVWNYGIAESHSLHKEPPSRAGTESAWTPLVESGADYFDQLLQLVPNELQTVYAHAPCMTLSDGEGFSNPRSTAFFALLNFSGNVTAQVEVNLSSTVPIDTGWTLLGTKGGYRNFRRYEITDDGEIFDIPVDPLPTDWDQFYEQLVGWLRQEMPPPTTFDEARRVVAVIDAARHSASLQQPVAFIEHQAASTE